MATNGESLEAQAETFMTKQLEKLVGYTVVRPVFAHVKAGSSPAYGQLYQLYPGLLLANAEGKKMSVWFLQDEEDNGPGYYDIQRVL